MKEIDVKDFEDQEKITAFFTQIKDRVKTRIGEMENENIRDTISISELLELVDERQVDDKEILEVANQLLAFTYERDKTKIQDVPNGEFLEKATEGLSSRSILDLRKKMKEEGFIGGGRY